MLLRGIIRTITCHIESSTQAELRTDSPVMPWLVEHAESILSWCRNCRDGRTPCEKVLERQISTEPMNSMNPEEKLAWIG